MDDKKLIFINSVLFLVVAFAVFAFIIKPFGLKPRKVEIREAAVKPAPAAKMPPAQSPYEIDSVRPGGERVSGLKPKDLADVYAKYPEEDVGSNIVEGWLKVAPKDKEKFIKGLDEEIEKQEEVLKVNPEDKKAKSMLKVSRMMKRAVLSKFNYDLRTQEMLKRN